MRKREIQEEISNKNYDRAIELLHKSKEMDKTEHPGLVSNYCKELIRIYDVTGRKEEYSLELTDYVFNERQDDLTYVYLLKDITPKEEWAEMREKIIESGRLRYIKFDFYVKEGLYGRLFNELNASPSVYSFLQYDAKTIHTIKQPFILSGVDCMRETVDRTQVPGEYIVDTGTTVRTATKVWGVSKSTVHTIDTNRTVYMGYKIIRPYSKSFFGCGLKKL